MWLLLVYGMVAAGFAYADAPSGWRTDFEWERVGFEKIGVLSVEFSPDYANDRMILAGLYDGARSFLYRTTDGGQTWSYDPDWIGSVRDIAFSPAFAADHTVFAAMGTLRGLGRSTDGGVTWVETGLVGQTFLSLAVSPHYSADQTLFSGNATGSVYRTTDGGQTWSSVSLLSGFEIRNLAISPDFANDHTIFAGTGKSWDLYSGGVYRSTDGGQTWTPVNTGLTRSEVRGLVISPDYAADHTLFVSVWEGGVYRSTDGGETWQAANTGQPNRRPRTLLISPFYAQDKTVFYGTWGDSPPNYSDGVYVTTNGGDSWAVVNNGLGNHFVYQFAVPPTFNEDPLLYAGLLFAPNDYYAFGGLWRYDFNGQPALSIGKTAPIFAEVGSPITYTLTVTNSGTATATNLLITDTIPAGAFYVTGGAPAGDQVQWLVAELPPSQTVQAQFVVTSNQTLVNSQYGVSADDQVQATGTTPVLTLVRGCPPLSTYVCVTDENDQPVAGARVFRNGNLLAGLTNADGLLEVSPLSSGETLAALQPVYQYVTDKAAHALPGATDNTAFQVYRTSWGVDSSGRAEIYTVDQSNDPHHLVIRAEQPLVLFNMVASVEWEADPEYINELKVGLAEAGKMLYNATDGQMAFGWISVYDNGEQWDNADIHVLAHNHVRPHAYVGGISAANENRLAYKNVAPDQGSIVLGRYWDGRGGNSGVWNDYDGYATITHEFGHYGLFLFDEYFYYQGDGAYRLYLPSRCSVSDDDPASLMYYQYQTESPNTEFCSSPQQYPEYTGGPPTYQTQVYGPLETSWVTLQGVYSDTLQAGQPGATPWRIVSPQERGAGNFVPGPYQIPLNWLTVTDHAENSGAFSKRIDIRYEGQAVWGALVSLHRANGQIIDQGRSSPLGEIDLLGAGVGDEIYVRSPDNSLGGQITVQNAGYETVHLTTTLPPGKRPRGAATGGDPLITIIPRSDGTTIDYFMSATDEYTVTAEINGAQAPAQATAAMVYQPAEARYAVNFSGFPTGTLSGLTLYISATNAVSQPLMLGIAHDRSWTDDPANDLNLVTTDGGLILNAPGNSLETMTYVVANPTNALPQQPPAGRILAGNPYSIQASGAVTGSQKAMALTLAYQPLSLGAAQAETLRPYYWAANPGGGGEWTPVLSYTLNTQSRQVSASITRFGVYALFAQSPAPVINSITRISAQSIIITGNYFQQGFTLRLTGPVNVDLDGATWINSLTAAAQLPHNLPTGTYTLTLTNPDNQTDSNTFTIAKHETYLPLVLK